MTISWPHATLDYNESLKWRKPTLKIQNVMQTNFLFTIIEWIWSVGLGWVSEWVCFDSTKTFVSWWKFWSIFESLQIEKSISNDGLNWENRRWVLRLWALAAVSTWTMVIAAIVFYPLPHKWIVYLKMR